MTFKTFDAENSPASQGFEPYSYDIVIAANVLHATASLQQTLENTRRLLKPGGHLLLFEITSNGVLRFANSVGGLSGWWVGVGEDDGRQYAPTVMPSAWHKILRKSGFSGADTITPRLDDMAWPFSIIASQAVNERVDFLRRPLLPSPVSMHFDELVILGTGTLKTSRLSGEVADLLKPFCGKIMILDDLPSEADMLSPMTTLINLVDLDYPIFKDMTQERMKGLKRIFESSKNILWLTRGAQADQPYHMASIGFGRTVSRLCFKNYHL
jgi:hybrid polyketide synthase/nonribosomal peptide synthetase ACE1